ALRPFDSETLSGAGQAARAVGDNETADRYAARAVLTAPDCRSERRPPAGIADRSEAKSPRSPASRTKRDGALPDSHPGTAP
ncbi:MAG: hypothetical protein OXQ29_14920, partial [Rhodospirillaceae bacterium]|nr:hypothetical protein [Rhodospirillaceae bacterium]